MSRKKTKGATKEELEAKKEARLAKVRETKEKWKRNMESEQAEAEAAKEQVYADVGDDATVGGSGGGSKSAAEARARYSTAYTIYSLCTVLSYRTHVLGTVLLHTPYTIHHTPSTIHHPPSTIHHPPSTIHHPPSTIHHPPSSTHHTQTPYTILTHHTPHTIHNTHTQYSHTMACATVL
jgi:hypothetical protein